MVDRQGVQAGIPVVGGVSAVSHDIPDQHARGGDRLGWGVDEPLLDRGPVTAVAGLLLGRKLVYSERLDAPLACSQFGVSLPPAAQLLSQPVVLRAELAAQPRPPQLSRGHHYCCHHDDDDYYYTYNFSLLHFYSRKVSQPHPDPPRSTGLNRQ